VRVTGPPLVAGPHAPATSTPPRSPGSVRRTTSIDTVRPGGPLGALVVDARGRDLAAGRDDADHANDLGEVALTLGLGAASHTLEDIQANGRPADLPDLRPLLGVPVGPGFRRLVDQTVPAERDRSSILHLLLDDLVGAVMVSGYALLHADALPPQAGLVDAMIARMGGGSVDARRRRIVDLRADALVLPWAECPAAMASAERLWGRTFDDLRLRVRRELVGTASCTRLNDTLRSLADLGALLSPREGP
jgi:hypothetical protein